MAMAAWPQQKHWTTAFWGSWGQVEQHGMTPKLCSPVLLGTATAADSATISPWCPCVSAGEEGEPSRATRNSCGVRKSSGLAPGQHTKQHRGAVSHLERPRHEVRSPDGLAAEAQQPHAQRRRRRRPLLRRRRVGGGAGDELEEVAQQGLGLEVDARLDAVEGAALLQHDVCRPRHLHAPATVVQVHSWIHAPPGRRAQKVSPAPQASVDAGTAGLTGLKLSRTAAPLHTPFPRTHTATDTHPKTRIRHLHEPASVWVFGTA